MKVEVPTWKPISPTEERIESNATWGTSGAGYLTPQKIQAGKQVAPILHRGFSYAVDDLSRLGSGSDPMGAIRNYLADAINKLKMATLLGQLDGLFQTAYAALETDVSSDAVPGSLTAANYLSAASAIAAKSVLGERADRLAIIVMHSSCYFYLQQTGMLTFSSDSLSSGKDIKWGGGGVGITNDQIGYFAGMRVIVDGQHETIGAGADQIIPLGRHIGDFDFSDLRFGQGSAKFALAHIQVYDYSKINPPSASELLTLYNGRAALPDLGNLGFGYFDPPGTAGVEKFELAGKLILQDDDNTKVDIVKALQDANGWRTDDLLSGAALTTTASALTLPTAITDIKDFDFLHVTTTISSVVHSRLISGDAGTYSLGSVNLVLTATTAALSSGTGSASTIKGIRLQSSVPT